MQDQLPAPFVLLVKTALTRQQCQLIVLQELSVTKEIMVVLNVCQAGSVLMQPQTALFAQEVKIAQITLFHHLIVQQVHILTKETAGVLTA